MTNNSDVYDIVIVADLRFQGGTATSIADEILQNHLSGYKTALIPVFSHINSSRIQAHKTIQKFVYEGLVDLRLISEKIRTKLLLAHHPLSFVAVEERSNISFDKALVVVHECPTGKNPSGVSNPKYHATNIACNIKSTFGKDIPWSPVSTIVREIVKCADPEIPLAPINWTNVIDCNQWSDSSLASPANPPIIGRYGRANWRKWPEDLQTIKAVYPFEKQPVKIMGIDENTKKTIGPFPDNWEVFEFDEIPVRQFLHQIDFFVYFHHSELTEAQPRSILESLASGTPVITHEKYDSIFADACLYCRPEDVSSIINDHTDPKKYRERVDKGIAWVKSQVDLPIHSQRISEMIGPPSKPKPKIEHRTEHLVAPPKLPIPMGYIPLGLLAPHVGEWIPLIIDLTFASDKTVLKCLESTRKIQILNPIFVPMFLTSKSYDQYFEKDCFYSLCISPERISEFKSLVNPNVFVSITDSYASNESLIAKGIYDALFRGLHNAEKALILKDPLKSNKGEVSSNLGAKKTTFTSQNTIDFKTTIKRASKKFLERKRRRGFLYAWRYLISDGRNLATEMGLPSSPPSQTKTIVVGKPSISSAPLAPQQLKSPVKIPKKLSGEIWAITTYFNPQNEPCRLENFKKFSQRLKEDGVSLIVVELIFPNEVFQLDDEDADIFIRREGADILWQKEALLNIALKNLPNSCDKVAWLDADVLLPIGWVDATCRALEEYVMVQPFSHAVRLEREQLEAEDVTLKCRLNSSENTSHGVGYGIHKFGVDSLSKYQDHGVTGFGMAIRKEAIESCEFYDANVVGSGDLVMLHAAMGSRLGAIFRFMTSAHKIHYSKWARDFYGKVKGSVGYIDGQLLHLWHGDEINKKKFQRHNILARNNYNPDRDLAKNSQGVLYWKGNNFKLIREVRSYMDGRG